MVKIVHISRQRLAAALLLPFACFALSSPAVAQSKDLPPELKLMGLDTIDVLIKGVPARLEVNPGVSGPIMLNPDIAEKAKLRGKGQLTIDFGEYKIPNYVTKTDVDFGSGDKGRRVAWTKIPVSSRADGVIGVHHLPYDRIVFTLGEESEVETVRRLKLKRAGTRDFLRIGTEIDVADETLFAVFTLSVEPNFVSGSTANFLATHQEGGFVQGSDSHIDMIFDLRRPTRDMRLAYPIELGGLLLETFAVRIRDHGTPDQVGEIAENDPRFDDKGILVSRRKRKGKPDLITRIGLTQLAPCSRITFDMKAKEIELSCVPQ